MTGHRWRMPRDLGRPFVLFCQARTGSSSLAQVLNCHPGIRCSFEPFNRDIHASDNAEITDAESLRLGLRSLWKEYNGIKHVATPTGWPFGNKSLNQAILDERDCDFVLVTRRNALRRAVSDVLARQTKIYHFWNEQDRDTFRGFAFKPLNPDGLRSLIEADQRFLTECRQRVRANNARYRELSYEDLFGAGLTTAKQMQAINELIEFLGRPSLDVVDASEDVARLLNVSTSASDSPRVYRQVPNIDEIEQKLGSDETGWLFK
jgi:hypothetical protein